jgi:trehalose utilization protein
MDIVEIVGWACFFYLGWQLLKSWIFVQNLKHRIAEAVEEEIAVKEAENQVLALRFEHVEENGHAVVLAYSKNNKFLGQGLTEDDAAQNIQICYPRHKIVVVDNKSTITKILDPVDAKSV